MAAALTLERVKQCLQQGKAEAQRLGVQAAIVVVDAAGASSVPCALPTPYG
jgi:uncharacterized protein GlcG (DUF336 family)